MSVIIDVFGREVLDSRGNPTVEVEVVLEDGSFGRAAVPSGASTGAFEAVELRDCDKDRYLGKGTLDAVESCERRNRRGTHRLRGRRPARYRRRACWNLTARTTRALWAQTPSWASRWPCAKAAAESAGLPLYKYMGGVNAHILPTPMMNILNGGVHADNNVDFQEFMIMPVGAQTLHRGAALVRRDLPHAEEGAARGRPGRRRGRRGRLRAELHYERRAAAVHREGLRGCRLQARRATSCSPWTRHPPSSTTLKPASTSWRAKAVSLPAPKWWTTGRLWSSKYPIISIEDGMAEKRLGRLEGPDRPASATRVQLVGDDLFVTNPKRPGRRASS